MAKTKTTLTEQEFEKQVNDFIDKVNDGIVKAQQWLRRKEKEIRIQVDKDLKNQEAYATKQGYKLNSKMLEKAIDMYLDAALKGLTSDEIDKLPATKHLKATISKSTDNDQYKKHLLEWPDTLKKQIIALQDDASKATETVADGYEKLLGSKNSELYNCFSSSFDHEFGFNKAPALKIIPAIEHAYFGDFKEDKERANVATAKKLGLDNFKKLYETTK